MDWQQASALLIVAAAAAALAWGYFRRRQDRFSCGSQCGCGSRAGNRSPGRIIFRTRKGERSQIVIPME